MALCTAYTVIGTGSVCMASKETYSFNVESCGELALLHV